MEYTPHNYLCQTSFLDKLSRGVIHRTVNRLLGVQDELHERHLEGLHLLVCSEPFIWNPWIEEFGRNIAHSPHFLQRLKKEMSCNNQVVACRAVCTLNELVHHPELAVEAIRIRIVPRFVKLLRSDNVIMLQRSLLCLKHFCMQPMGIASIIENEYIIEKIRDCIRHPSSSIVRCQAARTVNALSHNYFALHTLVEAGYVKVIMKCVYEAKDFNINFPIHFPSNIELEDLLVYHLDSLLILLDHGDGAKVAVMSEGVFELSSFLSAPCIRLKKAVASLFAELAKHPIGKDGIVAHGLIPVICQELVSSNDIKVKINMMAILQFATIHKEGRKKALDCNLIDILIEYLPKAKVPLNLKRYTVNTLTNLAEIPEGRQILRTLLSHTKLILFESSKEDENILRSIKNLYEVVNWEP